MIREPGDIAAIRIESSVSSQPSGTDPTRPSASEKPPAASTACRRNDMFAPIGLRI
jgi:hypothetical protein